MSYFQEFIKKSDIENEELKKYICDFFYLQGPQDIVFMKEKINNNILNKIVLNNLSTVDLKILNSYFVNDDELNNLKNEINALSEALNVFR
jgi:hypothetical protein